LYTSQKIFLKQVALYIILEDTAYFNEDKYLLETPDYNQLKALKKSTIQSDIMVMNL
jgi:hypothetical protein